MQVDTVRKVPRQVGLILVGVTLLLLVASSPAQASTTPQSAQPTALVNVMTHHVGTYLPTYTLYCTTFHHKVWLNAYGYIGVGYTEVDVGVCYDNNYRPTIQWGPSCPTQWYVPVIKTSSYNSCWWVRDYTGGITVGGNWTAELWLPFIGWCCDRIFTQQFGV
jgi:hypothetical protein